MVVRTALVMVALGATLSACAVRIVHHEFRDEHPVTEKVASVRFDSGSGHVSVRYRAGVSNTTVHRLVEHRRDNKPSGLFHRMEGDVLVLGDCGNNCTVNYDIDVPSSDVRVLGDAGSGDVVVEGLASLELQAGSGNVRVRDIAGVVRVDSGAGDLNAERVGGDVTAKLGSGNVRLVDIKGKSNVHTGSGDITGHELNGDVRADANSGNVVLWLVAERNVRAETGSGDITVLVPGGPYKTSVDSNSGDRRVDVRTDPAAPVELDLRAGSGNVVVSPA